MANLLPAIAKQQKSAIVKADKFLNTKTKTTKVSDVKNTETESPKLLEDTLTKIERKVIQIDKLLKDSLFLSKKEGEKKRKGEEQKEFEGREKELEKKKPKKVKGVDLPTPPKMGFIDWIKNFITQTILGFIAVRLIDYLPTLLSVLPTIIKATDFITDVGGKMLDGLITFIDWGYKAYDATRGFIKKIGGDGLAQNFDKFGGALNGLLDAAIVVGLASLSMGGDGGGAGGPTTGIRGAARQAGRSRYGTTAAAARRYAERFGEEAAAKRFGRKGLESLGGKYARSAGTNLARKAFVGLAGKQGAKAVLKFVKPLVNKIPIIGGLIEFGLSWALGEPVGKAAFRGIGSILVGAIGTVIGGPVGAFLGSWAGGEAGGVLYDMFFGNKNVKPKGKVAKAAGGGKPATRGGKLASGPAKRTIKKKKTPRTLRATPSKLKPGGVIGGEKNIKKLYPESKDKAKMSPFDFLKNTYDTFSKSTGLGALVALAIKPLMGDKPSYADYKNVGVGINNWMNQTVSPTTLAYAGGGEVRMESIVSGEDYSDVIARSVQDSVAPEIDRTIQDLMKQLMLKPQEIQKQQPPSQAPNQVVPGEELGNATEMVGGARLFMAAGFPPLAAAILAGNVQAESGWKGQRTPWVLNDGAGTNKGLISWNRSRITNAEKFLGKPLEKASNAEQVKWIKEELRQYGLLDEFMNPNSTEDQLKKASYKYIGWGIEGDRWKYSSRIFAALQKGEKGSYVESPVSGNVDLKGGAGKFVQGNSGNSGGIHFHIGPGTQPGQVDTKYNADARAAASKVVKHFLGKKPLYDGRRGANYTSASDAEMMAAQRAHSASGSQGGIDIQVGGAYDPGAKVPFPFAVSNMAYRPGGFGVSAKINGLNAFVAHGRYDENGRIAKQERGVNLYAFHGKVGIVPKDGMTLKLHKGEMFKVVDKDSVDLFGKELVEDIISIENRAQLVARAPSIIEKLKTISGYTDYEMPYGGEPQIIEVPVEVPVPMPMGGGGSSMIAAGGGVNSTNDMFEQTLAQLG